MNSPAELDIEQPGQLVAWLRAAGHLSPTDEVQVSILAGGVSNRTVLVERRAAAGWVVKQALRKLRVQTDWHSSPERVHQEALGLRVLGELAPGSVPSLVFEDAEHHLLAMSAVPTPHDNWKTLLLEGRLEDAHVVQSADLLAAIHGRAWQDRGRLAPLFAERRFFETLRLEPYYAHTATQVPAAAPFLDALIRQTRARSLTLVHGDFSPKNILVHDQRLVLLDHEVIHWGDPAFDLGFMLTHLLSKAHHLPRHRPAFLGAAQRFWNRYSGQVGAADWRDRLEGFAVQHTLGCLLARVAGRSPLEYLDATERARQRRVVLALLPPCANFNELFDHFARCLSSNA